MNKNYSCDIIKDLLPGYIDGVLSEASETVVTGHLEDCEKCNRYGNLMVFRIIFSDRFLYVECILI